MILKYSGGKKAPLLDAVTRYLSDGSPVILPTDTVYGLVCDGHSLRGKQSIYSLKGRPEVKSLIGFVKDIEKASLYAEIHREFLPFVRRRWPGRHTFIFPSRIFTEYLVTERQTIALRIPAFSLIGHLTERFGILASTSANVSGGKSPASLEQVPGRLKKAVPVAVDAGRISGTESAIWDATGSVPRLVRGTVLFVCSGGSCRSPMAHAYLQMLLGEGSGIRVHSAGFTSGGTRPTEETIAVMAEQGLDLTGFVSSSLGHVLLESADLVFVMERTHRERFLQMIPDAEDRIETLDVEDPFGKEISVYRDTRDIIGKLVETVVLRRIRT
jgi:tRNA threonylcarbamoyl adenosine modification protein (Sua5/YciO/YrdC/YwlC family)